MHCPLCNTELPDNSLECSRCDWVRQKKVPRPASTRDRAAVWLSLVPGLGHLYKGHVLVGALLFFVVGPALLAIALTISPATFGLSFLLLPAFLGFVMLHAYRAKDRRSEVIRRARELDHLEPAH